MQGEYGEAGRGYEYKQSLATKKPRLVWVRASEGGGDLLSDFRSTIGVVRFNFSVRNGKRWIPHAIATLVASVHGHRQGAAVAL